MLSFRVGSCVLGNTISIHSGPFKMSIMYSLLHKPFGNGTIFFIKILVFLSSMYMQGEEPLLIFALLN